jgi:hypothetical protein
LLTVAFTGTAIFAVYIKRYCRSRREAKRCALRRSGRLPGVLSRSCGSQTQPLVRHRNPLPLPHEEGGHLLDFPLSVADRSRFGDWEADLVYASKGKAALVSCNERKSRFLVLAKVASRTRCPQGGACSPPVCDSIGPAADVGLTTVRRWPGSKSWSRQPACARTFALHVRRGSVARTRTAMACCGNIFQGESASTRSRKRCS